MLGRWQLERIQRVIVRGGVIAYPTESVYGLGCDPNNLQALQKILQIKKRPADKGLIILISDIQQALPFILPPSAEQIARLSQETDRATTWLMPRKAELSPLLCGSHEKIAVRLTQHPIAKSICQMTKSALVSTSCNLSNRPEMKTAIEVRNKLSGHIDLIVNGDCGKQKPSQIIDLETGKILRK